MSMKINTHMNGLQKGYKSINKINNNKIQINQIKTNTFLRTETKIN